MYAPHRYESERFSPAVPQLVVCGRAKLIEGIASHKDLAIDVIPLILAQLRYPPGGDLARALLRLSNPDVIQHIEVMTLVPCTWTPDRPYCDSPVGHREAPRPGDGDGGGNGGRAPLPPGSEEARWWPHMARFHCNVYSSCIRAGSDTGVECKESPRMASDAMWSYYPVRTTDEEFARIKLYLASMLGAKYRMPTLFTPPGQGVLQIHANMLAPDLALGQLGHPETVPRVRAMRARLAELLAEAEAEGATPKLSARARERLVTRVLQEQLYDIRSDHMRTLPASTVKDAVDVASRILYNFSRWKDSEHEDDLPPDCTHEQKASVSCPTGCASSGCQPQCAYAEKRMSCIELCANAFLFAGHVRHTFIRPANALPARLLYCLSREGRCRAQPEAALYATIRAFQGEQRRPFDVCGKPEKPGRPGKPAPKKADGTAGQTSVFRGHASAAV